LDLKLNVVQAQQDEGGSRFELGLAVEVEALAAAKIDELRQAIDAADAAKIDHSVARSVIAGLKGTDKAASDGGWFWSACGVRTAHPLSASRVLLSHFSTQGMVISGPSDLAHSNAGTEYTVQLLAAHDQQTNAALAHALSGGSEGWDTGDPPWTVIAEVDQATAIPGLNLPPEAMADRLRALGLPSAFDIARFKQSLPNLPPAMFAMLNLTTAFANGLNGGLAAAWDRLSALLEKLSLSGVASVVLVHHADGRTILVISAIRLPFLGASMSPRRSSGFVWRALPITSGNFSVKGAGTRGLLEGGKGLASIAVVGYARTGLTDPFEYRVTAPEGAALDLPQYEFLMNILRQVTPAGVQVNTWELRRSHVALDPAKPPMPLPPKFARAFRPFQRPRFRDVQAEPITEPQRP
jgi:hypothetical protein